MEVGDLETVLVKFMQKNSCPFYHLFLSGYYSKKISAGSAPLREIKSSAYPADWQWNTDKSGFARIDTDLCCLETDIISTV